MEANEDSGCEMEGIEAENKANDLVEVIDISIALDEVIDMANNVVSNSSSLSGVNGESLTMPADISFAKVNGIAIESPEKSEFSPVSPEEDSAKELNMDKVFLLKEFDGWDPLRSTDWDNGAMSNLCIGRLKRDLSSIFSESPPLIYVVPEENNISKIHAVISGPANTPYEGGFFYFIIQAESTYPLTPPKVRLMTTAQGTVRFNPNFYKNGKVCLSILGTWGGPPWSPAQSLLSLVLSIQSLMNEKPYHNEPGFSVERCDGDSQRYNLCIIHETLRVAACDMAEGSFNTLMPDSLQQLIEECFITYKEHYLAITEKYKYLDGKPFSDPHQGNSGVYKFGYLEQRINLIADKLAQKYS